jgi:hypothetical protein
MELFPWNIPFDYLSRHSNNKHMVGYLLEDHGAGSDHGMASYLCMVDYDCAHAHIGCRANFACASDIGSRLNAHKISNTSVMAYQGTAIYEDMSPEPRVRTYDGTRADKGAMPQFSGTRNMRCRVNQRREGHTESIYLVGKPAALRGCDPACSRVCVGKRSHFVDPIDTQSVYLMDTSGAVHVLYKPGNAHLGDFGSHVRNFRREHVRAKDQQRALVNLLPSCHHQPRRICVIT